MQSEAPAAERVSELAAAAEAARQAQTELATLTGELAQARDDLRAARAEAQHLGPLQQRAAETAEVPDVARSLAGELLSAYEAVESAAAKSAEAGVATADARRQANDGPNSEVCRGTNSEVWRRLLDDHLLLVAIREKLVGLEADAAQAESDTAGAQTRHDADAAELRLAADSLDRVKAIKQAEALVDDLTEGEPCPICRQTVTALPDHDIDRDLERIRASHSRARIAAERSEAALGTAKMASIRAATRSEEHQRQRDELGARLVDAPDIATLESGITRAQELAAARSEAEAAESSALDAERAARKMLEGLEGEEKRARSRYGSARDGLAVLSRRNRADR